MSLRYVRGWLVAGLFVLCAGSKAAEVPVVDGEAISAETRVAMHDENFAVLEKLELRLRMTRAMQANGVWALRNFYFIASNEGPAVRDLVGIAAQEALLDRWHRAFPQSLVVPVLLGRAYSQHAFLLRGSEYASKVSAQQWSGYRQYVALSRKAFMSGPTEEASNPAWYSARLVSATSDTMALGEFTELLRASLVLAPDYNEPLRTVVHYAAPQWGGSPAMVESVAKVALNTAGPEAYAVLYTEAFRVTSCQCDYNPAQLEIQWPVFEDGMRSRLQKLHGPYVANMYAALTCNAGRMAFAQSLRPRLIESGKMPAAWAEFDRDPACARWMDALPARVVTP